jgi:hypothetical protein
MYMQTFPNAEFCFHRGPLRITRGGGLKNRFSFPYDFCTTFEWRIVTVSSGEGWLGSFVWLRYRCTSRRSVSCIADAAKENSRGGP